MLVALFSFPIELLIIIVEVAVLIIFFILLVVFLRKFKKKTSQQIEDIYHNTRHYVFDFNQNTVRYFVGSDMNTIIQTSFTSFINKFYKADKLIIKDWFNALLDEQQESTPYILCDMKIKAKKKVRHCINVLTMYQVDIKNHILEINSFLLRNLPLNDRHLKTTITKRVIENKIKERFIANTYGAMYYLSFYNPTSSSLEFDLPEEKLFILRLKDLLYRDFNADKRNYMLSLNETDCLIYSRKKTNKEQAYQFASRVLEQLLTYIKVLGIKDIEMAIGVSFTDHFSKDYHFALNSAKSNAQIAISQKVKLYIEGYLSKEDAIKRQMAMAINEIVNDTRGVNILYQPIISTKNEKVAGHLSFISPTNRTLFPNVTDIRTLLDFKQKSVPALYSFLINQAINYYSYKSLSKHDLLFLDVFNNSNETIISDLSKVDNKDQVKYVLKFSEGDLEKTTVKIFRDRLLVLRDLNYQLAIEILNFKLEYNVLVYENFDYFIVNFENFDKQDFYSSNDRLNLLSLLNTLKTYKVPICGYNINSWAIAEFALLHGVDYISGDLIQEKSTIIEGINENKTKRIAQIVNKISIKKE